MSLGRYYRVRRIINSSVALAERGTDSSVKISSLLMMRSPSMLKHTFQLTLARFSFVLLLCVTLLFTGCSSVPSDSDGRKYLEARGDELKVYKVQSFTKTNGLGDETGYTLEYEAQLECLRSTVDILWDAGPRVDCGSAGQIVKKKGALVFQKTENGWRADPNASR